MKHWEFMQKADLNKIKEAYRIQALKSHPKVDSSSDAQRRFSDLSRAYN
jgi:DnaJ-class molecular chaperone